MATATAKNVKDVKKKKTSAKEKAKKAAARKKKRENRILGKRDRNVAKLYGPKQKVTWLPRLKYRIILTATGKPGKPRADISGLVTNVTWEETGITLTGTVTVQAPRQLSRKDRGFTVKDGNLVRLDAWYGGKWRSVWTMRVWVPSDDLSTNEGTFTLFDDSKLAATSSGDFKYKKEKKRRPKGWKCQEIAIDICRKFKIPQGHLAEGKKDITDLTESNVSPLTAIASAYKQERDWVGTRFLFAWRNERLNITKLRRNDTLYALRNQITAAVVSRERGNKFFTGLEITAALKDGKRKHKKVEVVVVSHKAARRYGYIIRRHQLKKHVKSREEAIEIGRRIVAQSIRKHTQPTITISHPGIPWIRRGDAIEIDLPEWGFSPKPRPVPPFQGGSFDILFVIKAAHSIDSSGHTMDLEFTLADPVAEEAQEQRDARDKRRREQKKKEREKAKKSKTESKSKEKAHA